MKAEINATRGRAAHQSVRSGNEAANFSPGLNTGTEKTQAELLRRRRWQRTAPVLAVGVLVAACIRCQADDLPNGWHGFIGFKQFDIEYNFRHDTHPDDGFLPNAGVPGSAGTTQLGTLHYVAFGLGYDLPVGRKLSLNLDLGGLGGLNRDRHQNDNDPRPAAQGAFVFSEAAWGAFSAVGVSYHVKSFYLGAEGQIAGLFITSGWDRFNEDEGQHTEFKVIPSAGPKIGYRFSDRYSLEGTAQFGKSARFGILFKVNF